MLFELTRTTTTTAHVLDYSQFYYTAKLCVPFVVLIVNLTSAIKQKFTFRPGVENAKSLPEFTDLRPAAFLCLLASQVH